MKLIITMCMLLGASVCLAQAPLKKTELTVADRAAWQKVLGWPVELEQQWLKSRTATIAIRAGLSFMASGAEITWSRSKCTRVRINHVICSCTFRSQVMHQREC